MRIILLLLSILPLMGQAQTPPKIKVTPITDRLYVHTTFRTYGGELVPSNGIIAKTADGVVLVDTGWDIPTDQHQTEQLLHWVEQNLHQPVRLCIVTHFHDDRVGGIATLRRAGVRVVSTALTADKSEKAGYERPEGILSNDTTLVVGKLPIRCIFPGEGHTADNIVVWFPTEKLLHGGCFVKSYAAMGLGNVADANLREWANSVRRLQQTIPKPKHVIPGHQEWDKTTSLEHTIRLLEMKK
ncbi:subclass B1 metallo-beta-lactamase [Rudanella lutea]|uniref:subclass B1 metallo-beta-lactamase n=1 Tax=Rudanella lutea TaxID=451374 RepID=UPI0003AAC6B0|nr:subclass B1 metallo-beta-lactamase [Rudanella lutea]